MQGNKHADRILCKMITMKKIKFPKDELSHRNIVEWWYFNGHLESRNNKKYSYMHCLFKIDAKKIVEKLGTPLSSKIPLKPVYFFNTIILDISKRKSHKTINIISRVSDKSFSRKMLFIAYQNYIDTKFDFVNLRKYFKKNFNHEINEEKNFEYSFKKKNNRNKKNRRKNSKNQGKVMD